VFVRRKDEDFDPSAIEELFAKGRPIKVYVLSATKYCLYLTICILKIGDYTSTQGVC
jgi:hypothetical protein